MSDAIRKTARWPDPLWSGMLGRRHILTALLLPFIASLELLLAAAMPPAAGQMMSLSTPTLAPGEDSFVARYIESYVGKRAAAVRQRVDSISVKKAEGAIENGVYRSAWDVVLRFRLGYSRPEEDPFLSGMIRCLAELRTSSDREWVEWAEDEISRYRKEIQERMAFAQELAEKIVAFAEVDAAGYIDADTIRLQVQGMSEALPIRSLLESIASPEVYEALGYAYLSSAGKTEPGKSTGLAPDGFNAGTAAGWPVPAALTSGSSQSPSTGGTAVGGPNDGPQQAPASGHTPANPAPGSPMPAPSQPIGSKLEPRTSSPDGYYRQKEYGPLMFWGLGLLGLLLIVLVALGTRTNGRK